MTKQHKATLEQWAYAETCAPEDFAGYACIIELRDRIEALEAGQQPPQDKLDRLIALDRDDPTNSLVAPPMPVLGDAEGLAEVFWGRYDQPEPVAPTDEDLEDLAEVMNVSGNPVPAMRRALELWGNSQGILDSSPQPEPVAPTDAASRVAHYLEQRRLIRGLDPEVINALHAGTDEPRQAALTVSDLEALARWGTPAIVNELEAM